MKTYPYRLAAASMFFLSACATQETTSWNAQSVAPPPWPQAETAPAVEPAPPATPDEPEAIKTDTPRIAWPLTLSDAVVIAFENNRTIAVADLDPSITSTTIQEARAEFDPMLSASLRYGQNTNRTTSSGSSASTSGGANIDTSDGTSVGELLSAAQTIQAFTNRNTETTTTARSNQTSGGAALSQYFATGTSVTASTDYTGASNDPANDLYSGGWSVELRQALLQGRGRDINLITVRQAENDVASSIHGLRQQVISTVRDVELTYWDLALAREVLKINEVAVALADEQMRLNQDLLNAGRAVEADVLSAKAERATRQADLSDAQAQIEDRNLALIRLLNPDQPDLWQLVFEPEPAPEPAPVDADAASSVSLAMNYRPELAQARLGLANAELGTRRARNDLLPRVDLVATVGGGADGDHSSEAWNMFEAGRDESYGIGIEVETALYRRAEKARLLRSELQETQSERQIADTEQAIETAVRQAVVELRRNWDRLGSTREAVAARTSELETAQSRYASGRSTNLDVLLVQRDLISAQIDEVAARVGCAQALTGLYAAEGTLLERRGIVVETEEK